MAARISARFVAPDHGVPDPSSCGLDLWQSQPGIDFAGTYLHAQGALLQVSDARRTATLCCLLRRLPAGLMLASAYPYANIVGEAALFWSAGNAIRAALIRRGIVRLELPFTGDYMTQLPASLPRSSRARIADNMSAVRHVLDFGISGTQASVEQSFHPNIRWAIRKAARSGCSVRSASTREVDTIQTLYDATMRAKGAPVNYGPERWSAMLNDLAPRGLANILIGEVDGRPAGIAAYVDAAVSRHFIQLAVPPEFHASRLGELLVATALEGARAAGKRYFDFMSSPSSDAGLIAFKAKWGAREEPIHHVSIGGLPLGAPLIDAARWMNRTWARLSW